MKIEKDDNTAGKKALFAMAFHCHQPVFNFESEIEKAYKNSYLPLLEAVEEFEGIKTTFHFSGNTLEWIAKKHPETIALLHKLISNGQIEILGGGYYEPVLDLIPERDRLFQLGKSSDLIEKLFGVKPEGIWLTEKVWEPELIGSLARAGVSYTILDDHQLSKEGAGKGCLQKPCETDLCGDKIVVFPSLTKLRYSMPFRMPKVTLELLKNELASSSFNRACFFFADDAEKFGAWPYTYDWVHKKGWLRKFFKMLLDSSDWLSTMTYSDILREEPAVNVGEIPASSYSEMMAWSGGDFRNFLKKYPESERMYERMLHLSESIEAASRENGGELPAEIFEGAREELLKSQCGCPYWHGTFGGLYFPHLRDGVYRHLIKGQDLLTGAGIPGPRVRFSGEAVMNNSELEVFSSENGGCITEIDLLDDCINITNMLSRKREGYHDKLRRGSFFRMKKARDAVFRGEVANIHDVLGVRTRGLKKLLQYDDYQRRSFLTHVFEDARSWKDLGKRRKSADSFMKGMYSRRGDLLDNEVRYVRTGRIDLADIELVKRIRLGSGKKIALSQTFRKVSNGVCGFWGAIELNLSIWDDRLSSRRAVSEKDRVVLEDVFFGKNIEISLNGRYKVLTYPVYTVNETEGGLTRVYQGLSMVIGGPVKLDNKNNSQILDIIINIG